MGKIAVTGASGLLGKALTPALTAAGHEVVAMVRDRARPGIYWNPESGEIDRAALERMDAVVYLAGENVSQRWNAARKEKIRRSRVDGTELVARALAGLEAPPGVFVCGSATGYYGNRPDDGVGLDETAPPGDTFLAGVCSDWEAACAPAAARGLRVVNLRIGVVLSTEGGALAELLPVFRRGMGGRIGSGRQVLPWISMDDAVGAMVHALANETVRGPVNLVAPGAVTNREFTRALGRALGKRELLPVPAFMMKLLFGEMAKELILSGARILPRRLTETGYTFRYPALDAALAHLLKAN